MIGKQSKKRAAPSRLGVVVASLAGPQVRVLQAVASGPDVVVQRWGAAAAGIDDDTRARALVEALARAGIKERRVLVCLPAQSVVIKRVQLPPAAPEQLPQLVAYEAQRHLPLPMDQLASGYQVASSGMSASGSPALIAVTRKSDLARLERAIAEVGLRVEGYGVEPLAIMDAYLPGAVPSLNGEARLLLASDDGGLHAQVLCEGRLLLTRFLPFDGGNWAADLRRSVAAYSLEHPDSPIEEVVLLGEADREQIGQAVGQPVHQVAGAPVPGRTDVPPELSPLVGLARQALGLGRFPLRIEPQGWAESGRARGRSQALVAALGGIVLVAALLFWQLDQQRAGRIEAESAARITRQVERDRKMLALLHQKREALGKQLAALGLREAGASGAGVPEAPPLELLRRSTALAPAGIWFTQMTYEQGKPLQLQGTTRSAAEVTRYLRTLEQMSGFRRAELGYLRSATVNEVPVTHFRIDCILADPQTREPVAEPTSATPAAAETVE